MDGERAPVFIDIGAADSDALAAGARHKALLDLFGDRIHAVAARRKDDVLDLLHRRQKRVPRPHARPAIAEVTILPADVGTQRFVRTDAKFIQGIEIDMPHCIQNARRKKFQHGIWYGTSPSIMLLFSVYEKADPRTGRLSSLLSYSITKTETLLFLMVAFRVSPSSAISLSTGAMLICLP